MLTSAQLAAISRARLKDSRALLSRRRYDGCLYLSGYAVETALKARITQTLRWPGFPQTANEFKGLSTLKTHDLGILLAFTRRESTIKQVYATEWAILIAWEPEIRYKPIGSATPVTARAMFESARTITRALL